MHYNYRLSLWLLLAGLTIGVGSCEIRLTEAGAQGPAEAEESEQRQAELEAENEELLGRVSSLEAAVLWLTEQSTRMETEVGELGAATAGIEGRMESTETAAAGTAGRIDALETESESLGGRATALEAEASNHEERVAALESGAATQEERVTGLEEDGIEIDLAAYLPGTRWVVENPVPYNTLLDGVEFNPYSANGEVSFNADGSLTLHSGDMAAGWFYTNHPSYVSESNRKYEVVQWGGDVYLKLTADRENANGSISTMSYHKPVYFATAGRIEVGEAYAPSILTPAP